MEISEKTARHNARLIKEEESRMKNMKKIALYETARIREYLDPNHITSLDDLERKLEYCLNKIRGTIERHKQRPPTSLIN